MAGAPLGNDNKTKGKIVRSVVKKRLEERAALEVIVDKLIDQALEGDKVAAGMLFDRAEGKAAQILGGDSENPIEHAITNRLSETTSELLGEVRKGARDSSPEAALPH